MEETMRVERYNGSRWVKEKMWKLKDGDRFRMFNPNTNEQFVGDNGLTEWVVLGDPYKKEIEGKNIWAVDIVG